MGGGSTGSVRPSAAVAAEAVPGASGVVRQVLVGPSEGSDGFAIRRFIFAPGGSMPMHTNEVEHGQYVLAGEADVVIGGEARRVRAGDAVFIPSGAPHTYKPVGETPFEFLCVVPNRPDKTTILG